MTARIVYNTCTVVTAVGQANRDRVTIRKQRMDSIALAIKARLWRRGAPSRHRTEIFCVRLQESERSYNLEHKLRETKERQFIDDFKRAILIEGGYIPAPGIKSLGPEVNPRTFHLKFTIWLHSHNVYFQSRWKAK